MRKLGGVLAVLCLTLVAPVAMGDFHTPPHTNPDINWETTPPYQRNMTLDFAVDPVKAPGSGIPGATYVGYDDKSLLESDFVGLQGDVTWNPDLGAVGIFNTQGAEGGNILIHFDNWDRDWALKNLYVEYTYVVEGPLGSGDTFEWIQYPSGYDQKDEWKNILSLGSNTYTAQYWAVIEPNPEWEDIYITLQIYDASCTSIYLTDLQIATECVPVPGAALLALLGLGAAGIRLRRFV